MALKPQTCSSINHDRVRFTGNSKNNQIEENRVNRNIITALGLHTLLGIIRQTTSDKENQSQG